jgi:hypothetical protein
MRDTPARKSVAIGDKCRSPLRNVRSWPKADMTVCAPHVRFWGVKRTSPVCGKSAFAVAMGGQSGYGLLRCKCPLLTQSGHSFDLDQEEPCGVRILYSQRSLMHNLLDDPRSEFQPMLTASRLHQVLAYNPKTGIFSMEGDHFRPCYAGRRCWHLTSLDVSFDPRRWTALSVGPPCMALHEGPMVEVPNPLHQW